MSLQGRKALAFFGRVALNQDESACRNIIRRPPKSPPGGREPNVKSERKDNHGGKSRDFIDVCVFSVAALRPKEGGRKDRGVLQRPEGDPGDARQGDPEGLAEQVGVRDRLPLREKGRFHRRRRIRKGSDHVPGGTESQWTLERAVDVRAGRRERRIPDRG